MKAWIIPTVALLIVGAASFGGGYAVNEWQDGDEVSVAGEVATPEPTPEGPTQAELEAERQREEDSLCLEAQLAAAAAQAGYDVCIQAEAQRLQTERGYNATAARIAAGYMPSFLTGCSGVPPEVQAAIDRYCR
jgi:hypothetical protein